VTIVRNLIHATDYMLALEWGYDEVPDYSIHAAAIKGRSSGRP
jgi:hypothetical protein